MFNRRALMSGILILFAIPAMASQEDAAQVSAQTPPDSDLRAPKRCKVWAKCAGSSTLVCRVGCHATDQTIACDNAKAAAMAALNNCPGGQFQVESETPCPSALGCPCPADVPTDGMVGVMRTPVYPSENYSWRIRVYYHCCNGTILDVEGSGCSRCEALQSAWIQAEEMAPMNGGVKCCRYEILEQPCCCCQKSPRRCRR